MKKRHSIDLAFLRSHNQFDDDNGSFFHSLFISVHPTFFSRSCAHALRTKVEDREPRSCRSDRESVASLEEGRKQRRSRRHQLFALLVVNFFFLSTPTPLEENKKRHAQGARPFLGRPGPAPRGADRRPRPPAHLALPRRRGQHQVVCGRGQEASGSEEGVILMERSFFLYSFFVSLQPPPVFFRSHVPPVEKRFLDLLV